MDDVRALVDLAARQHGVVSVDQLFDLAISPEEVRWLVRQGWLLRIRRGVYAVSGTKPSPWGAAVGAVLAGGPRVAVSHSTAASIHRFAHLVDSGKVELTVDPPGNPRLPGVVLHRVNRPIGSDAQLVDGIRVTTPVRTLVDISNRLEPDLLARVVDEGSISGLWQPEQINRAVRGQRGKGRVRHRTLEAILEDRVGSPTGESWLENRVLRVLRPYLPFEVQFQVVLDGQVFILDTAWPRFRVAVECDGWGVRGRSRRKFDQDRRKSNLLAAHGWTVVHVTSAMSDQEILDVVGRVLGSAHRSA